MLYQAMVLSVDVKLKMLVSKCTWSFAGISDFVSHINCFCFFIETISIFVVVHVECSL